MSDELSFEEKKFQFEANKFALEQARLKLTALINHLGKGVNAVTLANAGALIATLTAFKDFAGLRGNLAFIATAFAFGLLSSAVAQFGLYAYVSMTLRPRDGEAYFIQRVMAIVLWASGIGGLLFAVGMLIGIVAVWRA